MLHCEAFKLLIGSLMLLHWIISTKSSPNFSNLHMNHPLKRRKSCQRTINPHELWHFPSNAVCRLTPAVDRSQQKMTKRMKTQWPFAFGWSTHPDNLSRAPSRLRGKKTRTHINQKPKQLDVTPTCAHWALPTHKPCVGSGYRSRSTHLSALRPKVDYKLKYDKYEKKVW